MPKDDAGARREGELFRAEAVAEQQDRWLGRVVVVPRLAHSVYVGFAALIVTGILGLLAFGEYTRKARLGGWLAPERGLIQVVAPQPGVLTRIEAAEGAAVEAGAPLAVLSVERRSQTLGATQGEVIRQLAARRDSLLAERDRQRALVAQQAAAAEGRLAALAAEDADLAREVELQGRRLALAERAAARQRDLRGRSIATEANLLDAEEAVLDQALALQALERQRAGLRRARLDLEAETAERPLREASALAEIDRAAAALEAEIAEAEAAREIVIAAPESGVVTALQAGLGGSVGPDAPLLTLVPAGSALEARLYGPSRAIGFVRPGQRVRLRYDAFPHQKFGLHEGVVRSVSRSTVGPAELGDRAATLRDLLPGEPVYRVTVALAAQSATAYGEAVPLQPGLRLEADVLIETRPLYRWVLDPLAALGRERGA